MSSSRLFALIAILALFAMPLSVGIAQTCPNGQVWDSNQNKCVDTQVQPDPDTGNCPSGYTKITDAPGGQTRVRCIHTSTLDANCATGQHWDAVQNRCVSDTSCPTGKTWDTAQRKCVDTIVQPDPDTGNCPSGYTKVTDTPGGQTRVRCVLTSTLDANCPGSSWDPVTNSCVGGSSDPNTFDLKIADPIFGGKGDFLGLLENIIEKLMLLAVPVAIMMVLYAAFLYTTSGGNEERVQTANKAITYVVIGFAVLLLAKFTASIVNDIVGTEDATGEGVDMILEVGRALANVLIAVVSILSVIFIVLAGLQFVTSGGDEEKVRKARDYILYAIIGLVVALLSFGVTSIVNELIDRAT
jgi:hypothetical protein